MLTPCFFWAFLSLAVIYQTTISELQCSRHTGTAGDTAFEAQIMACGSFELAKALLFMSARTQDDVFEREPKA